MKQILRSLSEVMAHWADLHESDSGERPASHLTVDRIRRLVKDDDLSTKLQHDFGDLLWLRHKLHDRYKERPMLPREADEITKKDEDLWPVFSNVQDRLPQHLLALAKLIEKDC